MTERIITLGAHVSAAGGVQNAPGNARAIGAGAFALFTRNQRRWHSPGYTTETITLFRQALSDQGFAPARVLPHAGYLINLGSPDEEVREKSIRGLADELERTIQLGLELLNFHPGTSKGQLDEAATCRRIADGIDQVLRSVEDTRTAPARLVLENTAGQGNNMGATFSQLARIIEASAFPDRLAVCVDTCHAFAAGFDIRTATGWDALMADLEDTLGLERLAGLHLNDSLGALGSKKDRHQPIGEGEIGLEGFRAIMKDQRLDGLPLILETPDPEGWPREIELLLEMSRS
ncbi:endonuclease IV [Alkalispirochaeta sphaeroplastigenens]|uniref:Probable endonuclease 4 n=1 Tax=Alkalispirochaeta sphaeroplastigenens TaxID=1187066 RepID=A0A2S4JVV6_9SPIO|nr:deoxyribonuclease IV [Alkalispirochaeta sphaeroplastigenens]POR03623.1 endonuclease IV [Alkalispirochaeta sphaeroplastigenens]